MSRTPIEDYSPSKVDDKQHHKVREWLIGPRKFLAQSF